jgi:hypothetical protein
MRALFMVTLSSLRCFAANFHLQVEVVDEYGKHMPSVEIVCDTLPVAASNIWNAPGRRERLCVKTDINGVARLEGQHALPQLVISASTDNFYTSTKRLSCEQKFAQLILVKKLEQVKCRRLEVLTSSLPQDGNSYGFDLMIGAFTPPLGVGRYPDVFIKGKYDTANTTSGVRALSVSRELEMRYSDKGSGFQPTPRPGQKSFGLSIAAGCDDQAFPELFWPRIAPQAGYQTQWAYTPPAMNHSQIQGGAGGPQWIFRIRPEQGYYRGVLTDFHWLPDGRLRMVYELSEAAGNPSLEFIK